MNSIVKNRYFDALLKLMLLSAVLHMFTLFVYFLIHLDASRFNFFKIINIDLFFPELITNQYTNMYSIILGIFLYICLYYFFTKKK